MNLAAAPPASSSRDDRWLIGVAAAATMLLTAASAFGPYGYFIDEFYYLACARRPALGYVDHPPLAPLLLAAVSAVFGQSLLVLRILAALVAGCTVYVGGRLAREWGGGRFAQLLTAIGTAALPMWMVTGSFYSMNCFELLMWGLLLLVLSRIANAGAPRLWLVFGVLAAVGFLFKHTTILLLFGLIAGVVATPLRRHLLTPWPWAGAALALLVVLPNVGWEVAHGWPTIEFYREATARKNIPTSPLGVLSNQALAMHPFLLPVWATGAVALVVWKPLRPMRFAAVAWWLLLAMMMLSRSSRPDRIAGLAVALLAAGSIAWERWVTSPRARVGILAAVGLAGAALAPLELPILSFEKTARYAAWTGAAPPIERGKTSPLPQWLADRTGWESMLADVAGVYHSLPPEDRRRAILYAPDYGTAGALELWGPARGLPPVICSQNSFYHWSEGHTDSEVLIAIGGSQQRLSELYSDVQLAGRVSCKWCMSWRSDRPIHVARRPISPLSSVWSSAKHYE